MSRLTVVASALLILACGSSQPEPQPAPAPLSNQGGIDAGAVAAEPTAPAEDEPVETELAEFSRGVERPTVDAGAEGEGGQAGGREIEGGVEGDVVGGVSDNSPPPADSPGVIPPDILEGRRVAGEKYIVPDDRTKLMIKRDGKDLLIATFQMCLDDTGRVDKVVLLKSSGYPSYDLRLTDAMKQWRYRPYEVDGTPKPVCSAITFVYKQRNADD